MIPLPLNDEQIRDLLLAIYKKREISVTTLEAEFLEATVDNWHVDGWSVERRARAAQIAEKYRHQI